MAENNRYTIKKYNKHNLIVNTFLVPLTFVFGIYYLLFVGTDAMLAVKRIREGTIVDAANNNGTIKSKGLYIDNSNVYYESLIKLRKDKLEKISYWKSEENQKKLDFYKSFYDGQIMNVGDNDYPVAATEITRLARKNGIVVKGINAGAFSVAKNVKINILNNSYVIYEKTFSVDFIESIGYDRVKGLLEDISNNIKLPTISSLDIVRKRGVLENDGEIEKISLTFYYKAKNTK